MLFHQTLILVIITLTSITADHCPANLEGLFNCYDTILNNKSSEVQPRFDLTGEIPMDGSIIYVTQYDNGEIYRTFKTEMYDHVFRGYYINETHVVGMQTRLNRATGCVAVQHIRLIATQDRGYCSNARLSPLSVSCGLIPKETYSFCTNY